MGSLSYLQDYGSSESEDETIFAKPKFPQPSLPTYAECRSVTRTPLNRDTNNKKIRNFPHEPGNFATYVYVPFNGRNDLQEFAESLIELLLPLDMEIVDDFHISVTKTVTLRHHWIKDFMNSLSAVIASMIPFYVHLSGFKVYLNEAGTRTFVALKVGEGLKELGVIVQEMDKCLADYNLPPFYKSPSFHMSILWCVGNKLKELNDHLNNLQGDIDDFQIYDKISHLKCTSGNKIFTFNMDVNR